MKLKIHSWGGLGSQLHALSLMQDLKQYYPNRKLILIHHTSGVSKRLFEADVLLDKSIELRIIDDYISKKSININKKRYFHKYILRLAKQFLIFFSIIVDVDNNNNRQIKSWTKELRGHYSKRKINKEFLKRCVEFFLSNNSKNIIDQDALVIHYRLGDLLTLAEKTIISADRIIDEVKGVLKYYQFTKLVVYSDSIDDAKLMLSKLDSIFEKIEFSDAATIEVMEHALKGKYFIGTNSKVSFWVEELRNFIEKPSLIINTN